MRVEKIYGLIFLTPKKLVFNFLREKSVSMIYMSIKSNGKRLLLRVVWEYGRKE